MTYFDSLNLRKLNMTAKEVVTKLKEFGFEANIREYDVYTISTNATEEECNIIFPNLS
jgi:hypothetical protein